MKYIIEGKGKHYFLYLCYRLSITLKMAANSSDNKTHNYDAGILKNNK